MIRSLLKASIHVKAYKFGDLAFFDNLKSEFMMCSVFSVYSVSLLFLKMIFNKSLGSNNSSLVYQLSLIDQFLKIVSF